jgi:hypothetical protein
LYLNPEGIIPPSSAIAGGEQRTKGFREQRQFDRTSFAANDFAKMDAEPFDIAENDQEVSGGIEE